MIDTIMTDGTENSDNIFQDLNANTANWHLITFIYLYKISLQAQGMFMITSLIRGSNQLWKPRCRVHLFLNF